MHSYHSRQDTWEESIVYDHLRDLRQVESPEQVLDRFVTLFIDGVDYPDPSILAALHTVAAMRWAQTEFRFFLNRCCHILTNYWGTYPACQPWIVELVDLFECTPLRTGYSQESRRLQQLVQQFRETEQYKALRRLRETFSPTRQETADTSDLGRSKVTANKHQLGSDHATVRKLVHRYPFLYPYCLGSDDTEGRQMINQVRLEREQKIETDLSRYLTSLVRQQAARPSSSASSMSNPTLLSQEQFIMAAKQFAGKIDGPYTCKDLARQFLKANWGNSYLDFKHELHQYLTREIGRSFPRYNKSSFSPALWQLLRNMQPQNDDQPLQASLLGRTCNQLMDTLLVNPQLSTEHMRFIDLTENTSATHIIDLLLKILLLCQQLQSNLERRFAALFKHYELFVRDGIDWLVQSLENLQIALSIHFGVSKLDFSLVNQL
ncbi:MAG: hypothetical protein KME45_19705 [Stenomitos rutilans HA7619-LM2]|jgi:hypothetical protein|nr:hypothetical protein [Stenomitos rutilans HA7619-LM2]